MLHQIRHMIGMCVHGLVNVHAWAHMACVAAAVAADIARRGLDHEIMYRCLKHPFVRTPRAPPTGLYLHTVKQHTRTLTMPTLLLGLDTSTTTILLVYFPHGTVQL